MIEDAISYLHEGRLIALPTETVYGLAADACDDQAVAAIFEAKGRPTFNPLIVHVPDINTARQYTQWNALADRLAKAFWPGPLTLILPRAEGCRVSLLASAGGNTLGVRMPAHPLSRELLRRWGGGVAAPSANRSGKVSPTSAAHVEAEEFDDVLIVDGGPCPVGIESTVVDCTGEHAAILRPGSITQDMIEQAGVKMVAATHTDASKPLSPGMLSSHYAPNHKLRLHASDVSEGEALLAFGANPPEGAVMTLNLSESGDVVEAAANLFAYLRQLDASDCQQIAVMDIPYQGVGVAINDRLKRAAADVEQSEEQSCVG